MYKRLCAICILVIAATGCTKHSIDREAARSDLRSALSIAAEAELFTNYVIERHATKNFVEGHARELREFIDDTDRELQQPVTDVSVSAAVTTCRAALQHIRDEVSQIPHSMGDEAALRSHRDNLAAIHKQLLNASGSL